MMKSTVWYNEHGKVEVKKKKKKSGVIADRLCNSLCRYAKPKTCDQDKHKSIFLFFFFFFEGRQWSDETNKP